MLFVIEAMFLLYALSSVKSMEQFSDICERHYLTPIKKILLVL